MVKLKLAYSDLNNKKKRLGKMKTSFKTNTPSPYYNETFTFDLNKEDIQVADDP